MIVVQAGSNPEGLAAQSWLAPRARGPAGRPAPTNTLTIALPHAVALSKLRVWNYHKSPERGACEVDVLLDDQLIYFGHLARAEGRPQHQALLFSNHPGDLAGERAHVRVCAPQRAADHVVLFDEGVMKSRAPAGAAAAMQERPATAVVV